MREHGRTYLQACLLLLIAEHPDHGYQLTARLSALGFADADVDTANTYRTLRGLEREGALASSWSPSDRGPARRTYHLTGHGLAQLAEYGAELRSDQARTAGYLRRFEAIPRIVREPRGMHGRRRAVPAGQGVSQ